MYFLRPYSYICYADVIRLLFISQRMTFVYHYPSVLKTLYFKMNGH